jgi:hypothetical protein
MLGRWWGIKMLYILAIPPDITIIIVAIILIIPFVFYYNFLKAKIAPNKSGKNFILFIVIVIISLLVYITATTSIIVAIAKIIK